jgi:UDP-glucuronate 4-epimerase
VHLAARAGVRPSIEDPFAYVQANVVATARLLEASRLPLDPPAASGGESPSAVPAVKHFVYASSSSVKNTGVVLGQKQSSS